MLAATLVVVLTSAYRHKVSMGLTPAATLVVASISAYIHKVPMSLMPAAMLAVASISVSISESLIFVDDHWPK